CAASIITRNPTPRRTSPKPNLSGADGSRLRLPSVTQIQAKTGASSTTQMGLAAWYQLAGCTPAGNNPPSSERFVKSCANRLNVVAACSKPPQKSAEHTKK